MSQSLGDIAGQLPDPEPGTPTPPVRPPAPKGKFNTMLMSLVGRVAPSEGPEEMLELAAVLESEGVTDAVAARYQATSVFSLSRDLLAAAPAARAEKVSQPAPATATTERLWPSVLRSVLVLGMMGVMLVGVQWYQAAMRALGVPDQATMVGLFAGMVIASGMTQATGWRVSVALSQGTPGVVGPVLRLGLTFGMGIALLASALLVGVGMEQAFPPAGLFGLGASCLGLTLLLLLSGGLVLLDHTYLVSIAIAVAGGLAWLLHTFVLSHANLFVTVGLGYLMAVVLLGALLFFVIGKLARGGRGIHRLPPLGQLMYNAIPYLFYGTLTVLYVFLAQLSGWLGRLPDGWSREQAVASLNIAHLLGLMTIVMSQGVAEYGLRIFWHVVRDAQAHTKLGDTTALKASVGGFLRHHLRVTLISQTLIAIVFAALVTWLWQALNLTPVLGPLVPSMLYISLIGYTLLLWGLFGCSFSVTVAHPWMAVRALFVATVIQFVCGTALAVFVGFEASLAGTIIGGVALILISRRTLAHLLDRVDYLLYQAF
jgi:hypothetical protein